MELLKQLGFNTAYAAAYAFFLWLDKNASDEAKVALARTMKIKDYKSVDVASALVEVFDRIFVYGFGAVKLPSRLACSSARFLLRSLRRILKAAFYGYEGK